MAYSPRERTKTRRSYAIGHARYAWLRLYSAEVVVQKITEDERRPVAQPDPEEGVLRTEPLELPGDDIYLWFNRQRQKLNLNLSELTEKELTYFRSIINEAIDLAMPAAIARDKEAANAFAQGDDRYPRVYRQVPQYITTEGSGREYPEGVQFRPTRVSRRDVAGTDDEH